ncbi:MAG: non-homologous end-joining DNA ligase [Polyangiaceae bacterium]
MFPTSHPERVVFPEIGATKGDVVAYYERLAPKLLPHVGGRALTLKRYPKGAAGPGFFQKNVPPHYPASIARLEVPKKDGVTTYPILSLEEHLPYVANQGAIELHVPCGRAATWDTPDRVVIDLDPPPGGVEKVRVAAKRVKAVLDGFGLPSTPVATGSKGYHIVAPIAPTTGWDTVAVTLQKLGAWLAHTHPDELTVAFRVKAREGKVFVDWLRNVPNATVVAPYGLRARPKANVATPITWDELDAIAPDAFSIRDADALLERPDPLIALESGAPDLGAFAAQVDEVFAEAKLEVERFDRFRS